MSGFARLVQKVRADPRARGPSWALKGPAGDAARFGDGEPEFAIVAYNERGVGALTSFTELGIAEAYMRGDVDFEGDMVKAMELRKVLKDPRFFVAAWAHVSPMLLGRRRLNPRWIAKHYDTRNVQVLGLDEGYAVYTPGIYEHDGDTLEAGADRKLDWAFSALGLHPGRTLLDVGCGWGGMLRYCARRGVEATGITLSHDQLDYAQSRLKEDDLDATVLYQDFFTYEPGRRFDGISMMGVIEDLSDYDFVMERLRTLLAPGGRVYLDFASANRRYGIPSMVTKHIWPGKFRMVWLPEFTRAVVANGFEVRVMENDRHNYHLWTAKVHERWVARRDEVLEVVDEATWRLMRLLQAGVANAMGPTCDEDSAYRVVLDWRRQPAV